MLASNMKTRLIVLLPVVAVLGSLLFCGCEVNSANTRVTITPGSVAMRKGDSVTFKAEGGYEYSWSISPDSYGTLSPRTGPTTTFAALSAPADSVQIVVTATTYITGLGGNTNGVTTTAEGEAFITLQP